MTESTTSPSLWRRLSAMVYDAFLILAFAIVCAFFWKLLLSTIGIDKNETLLNAGYLAIWGLSLYGFFQFFWLRSGQTLGMLAWRLQVRKNDGSQLKLIDTSIRWLTALLSAACLGLGYLWALIDKDKRTWHDIISKTHVVILPQRKKHHFHSD